MAINKNFVVKNGIQVADALIYGDTITSSVGIGTTLPLSTLDVRGRINATSIGSTTLFISGISTLGTTNVSTINIQTGNIVTGVVTTLSGTTATYTNLNGTNVYGVTGVVTTLSGTTASYTNVSVGNSLTISGPLYANNSTGTTGQILFSTGTGIGWTTISTGYASTAGIATYANTAGIATYSATSGISTNVIGGIGSVSQIIVSGISTFSGAISAGGTTGTLNQVLRSTGTGIGWTTLAASGGSGVFNTGITTSVGYAITTGMATAYTAPSTAGDEYIVYSVHVTNIDGTNSADVSGQLYAGQYSIAQLVPVPAGSSVELLKQPKILAPNETVQLQASANNALHATITVERRAGDTSYVGVGTDITAAATYTDLWTATANSVLQSILIANDDGTVDAKARVVWTNGSNTIQGYYAYDMVIPANATVEVLEQPKYLPSGFKVRVYANAANRLEAILAARTIA